jgi:hypothetical protein
MTFITTGSSARFRWRCRPIREAETVMLTAVRTPKKRCHALGCGLLQRRLQPDLQPFRGALR